MSAEVSLSCAIRSEQVWPVHWWAFHFISMHAPLPPRWWCKSQSTPPPSPMRRKDQNVLTWCPERKCLNFLSANPLRNFARWQNANLSYPLRNHSWSPFKKTYLQWQNEGSRGGYKWKTFYQIYLLCISYYYRIPPKILQVPTVFPLMILNLVLFEENIRRISWDQKNFLSP